MTRFSMLLCLAITLVCGCTRPAQDSGRSSDPKTAASGTRVVRECDPAVLEPALTLVESDSLRAVELLLAIPDCDEKFAALYRAEARIAARSDHEYFYQNQVNPRGWNDRSPSAFEQYVIDHVDHFHSAGEGAPIRANDFWLRRIANRRHEAIGDFELHVMRVFDESVWKDGDGRAHSRKLIRDYEEWLQAWPSHPSAPSVRRRIDELRRPAPDSSWTLPVADGGGVIPSPPSVQGYLTRVESNLIALKRDRPDGEASETVVVRLTSKTEFFSAYGGLYTPDTLRAGQYVWVWYIAADPRKAGTPPQAAVVMLWSSDPDDKPSDDVRWHYQKRK